MNSSIFDSEPTQLAPQERGRWRAWLWVFCRIGAAAFGLLYAFLVLIDPYDSGRFPSFGLAGTDDKSLRTAGVSLARDARYDAAVIGNSSAQQLHPGRLSQLTGFGFVQLSVVGARPAEQLAVLRWFARHHAHIAALVLVTDRSWCTQDPSLPSPHPFPFWLYSDSDMEYLLNLFSGRSIQRAFSRLGMGLGWRTRNDTAGYFDYGASSGVATRERLKPPPASESAPPLPEPSLAFPAVDRLEALLAGLAPTTPVVIVAPPAFASNIPRAGTGEAAELAACRTRLAHLARAPRRQFIDYLVDGPATRDPENFLDVQHMLAPLARQVEASIAAALKSPP